MTRAEKAKTSRIRRLAQAQIIRTILETPGGTCELIDGRMVFGVRPVMATGGDDIA
jgi:hypothetical protein